MKPIRIDIPASTAVVEQPINHIFVVDCSGSMSSDLPTIRTQLKNKIPSLLKENDTISVIWFSGRNESGILVNAEQVDNLGQLKRQVLDVIDRWIRPVGMTAFVQPLQLVADICKAHPTRANSMIFLTDGQDNCYKRNEIYDAAEALAPVLASAVFVEYGYYSDRKILEGMASVCSGTVVFAKNFDEFEVHAQIALAKKITRRVTVAKSLDGDFSGETLALCLDGDELRVLDYSAGPTSLSFSAPEGTTVFVVDMENPEVGDDPTPLYAAASVAVASNRSKVAKRLLAQTGDKRLIAEYKKCFGKQSYLRFSEHLREVTFNEALRYQDGKSVPTGLDNSVSVMQLLKLLSSDSENRVLLDSPDFRYNRISRGRDDALLQLSDEESQQVADLAAQLSGEKDPVKVAELAKQLSELANNRELPLVFKATPAPEGYPISSLVYNSTRPNVSINVRKQGTVDLTGRKGLPVSVPAIFDTFIYRSYAIMKDGLLNVAKLPVAITKDTFTLLRSLVERGLMPASSFEHCGQDAQGRAELVLNLEALPVLSEQEAQPVQAADFFKAEVEELLRSARLKVFKNALEEVSPKETRSKGFVEEYGPEATAWLKEMGFTDYSGFSPKAVQSESTDFYVAREVEVAIKGYSSLPAVKKVRDEMAKSKAKGIQLMAPFVAEVDKAFGDNTAETYKAYLENEVAEMLKASRKAQAARAQVVLSIVVGQELPEGLKSTDDPEVFVDKVSVSGAEYEVELRLKNVEVKI